MKSIEPQGDLSHCLIQAKVEGDQGINGVITSPFPQKFLARSLRMMTGLCGDGGRVSQLGNQTTHNTPNTAPQAGAVNRVPGLSHRVRDCDCVSSFSMIDSTPLTYLQIS
eukprot:COSAG01_NODE_494_length_16322_cov_35.380879_3_plen_110_part_00